MAIKHYHTSSSRVVSNESSFNTEDLGPCSREESHHRMILYVADMLKQNITKILIVNNDTDVLSFPQIFSCYYQFRRPLSYWITFGTGKAKRFISLYTIAGKLVPEKCEALVGFHAITSCDSVSALYRKPKSMLGIFGLSSLQLMKHFVSYPILQQVFLIPFYN